MRHHGCKPPIGRGHGREASCTAVGVKGVLFGRLAVVVHKAHRTNGLRCIAPMLEVGKTLAVGDCNRQAAACHALEEKARRVQHLHHRQASFKALALIGGETRPSLRARDDVGQFGKHLATIANAQTKAVAAAKKCLELIGQSWIESDAARPANACAQRVAIAEATASDQAFEVGQVGAARLQVGHVHVVRLETGFVKSVGHFHMRIDTLLTQDRHFRARQIQEWRGHVVCRIDGRVKAQRHMHAGVIGAACGSVLGIGASKVVALLANLPAHAVPDLVQVFELGGKHLFGVAPHTQLAHAFLDRRLDRPGFADHMRVFGQAMFTQGVQHRVALGGAHLQHHAQLFVEQGLEGEFVAAGTDLTRPVLGVAMVSAAVRDAVALSHQHVHIERHAYMACKRHFGHSGQQAAIAAVVVSQDLALTAQSVDGFDQIHQRLWVFEIGYLVAKLVQHLTQHTAAHAVAALAQVDQQQAGVSLLRIQLRR